MSGAARLLLCTLLCLTGRSFADHVIVTGGPALRAWENFRIPDEQHDRWWGNFVRASTLRMDEISRAYGPSAPIVWIVYRPSYVNRGKEDNQPYTRWIADVAAHRHATLVWVDDGPQLISAINNRPKRSIHTFDYFGHSNCFCFMLDYGNHVMAACTAWLHEDDVKKLNSSVFAPNAYCKSWGCHTGESMSLKWKSALGIPLEGANGKTDYTVVSKGLLPAVDGGWVR